MPAERTRAPRGPVQCDRYQEFGVDRHTTVTDERQRRYLRSLLRRSFPVRRPVQHDFACGTGRAIRLLHGLVHTAHGYDFCEAVLARARTLGVPADLHLVPLTDPPPKPPPGHRPVVVTCAGFLATAEPPARDLALTFAAEALPHPESGVLVVEHHRRRGRRRLRHPDARGLSHAELARLLARHGFRVTERRGFGLVPAAWYRWPTLRWAAFVVDGLALRLPSLAPWCATALYVARRDTPSVRQFPAEAAHRGGGEQA